MANRTDFTDDWAALNHPLKDNGCVVCGAGGDVTISDTGPVQWRCAGCRRLVCRECALCFSDGKAKDGAKVMRARDGGREYLDTTLCSVACWERLGCRLD